MGPVCDKGPFTIEGTEPVLIVNASSDLIVSPEHLVELDGSGSYATDGATLSFLWQPVVFPENALPEISSNDESIASWTPTEPGEYLFKLEVSDTEGRSSGAYKRVTVTEETDILNGPLQIRQLPDGRVEVRWDEGLEVGLERSDWLTDGSWSQLLLESEAISGERVLVLTPDQTLQFFRLVTN